MNTKNKMSFGKAIEWVKSGDRMSREGWNGKDMWIEVQMPDEDSEMTLPYIFIKTVQGDLVPWVASQTDLFAEDWMLV